jgi:hypothetical protein
MESWSRTICYSMNYSKWKKHIHVKDNRRLHVALKLLKNKGIIFNSC